MKSAGIKVWVLTGDKVGTAINIGISAGLLDQKDDMDMHYVLKEDSASLSQNLEDVLNAIRNNYNDQSN